jgi:hypothetical protein
MASNGSSCALMCQIPQVRTVKFTHSAVERPLIEGDDRIITFQYKRFHSACRQICDKSAQASLSPPSLGQRRRVVDSCRRSQFNDGVQDLLPPPITLVHKVNPSLAGHDKASDDPPRSGKIT